MILLNADEAESLDRVNAALDAVLRIGSDRLRSSQRQEAVAALHVLQSYVVQHAIHRLDPDAFSNWYEPDVTPTSVGENV